MHEERVVRMGGCLHWAPADRGAEGHPPHRALSLRVQAREVPSTQRFVSGQREAR